MSEWPFQVVMHYWSRGAQCSLKIINIPSVLVKSTIESITQNAVDEVGWKGGMEMMLVLARACFCVWTCKASQLRTAGWKPSTNPVDGELVAQLSENPASDTSLVARINSGNTCWCCKDTKTKHKSTLTVSQHQFRFYLSAFISASLKQVQVCNHSAKRLT